MNDRYAKAYTEVLEILKYLPKGDYEKIPKEKIEFYEKNKDTNYEFSIDPEKPLEEQNISVEANSVIVNLFCDYFASDRQKEIVKLILQKNEEEYQKKVRKRYNPDNIFD